MRQFFWMGIGVALGVIAFRKVTEAKSTLGPRGLNRTVSRLVDEAADFTNVLRNEMRARETELRATHIAEWGQPTAIDAVGLGSTRQDAARRPPGELK